MTRPPRSTGRLVAVAVALVAGLFGSGLLVWSASSAAFSGKTSNTGNTWNSGAVVLADDDGGSAAMFSASGLTPNTAPQVSCIAVTYNGTVTTPVKLYGATPTGTGLGTYLNLQVDVGTAASTGSFNNCTGFVQQGGTYIYSGTLAGFATSYTNYGNGLATGWSPTGTGQVRVFRFTTSVQDNNLANGLNCGMPFTWEAQA